MQGQAAPISRTGGEPQSRHGLKTHARSDCVSLILRNRKLARIRGVCGFVAEEESSGDGSLSDALLIGVAYKSRKAAPVRHANLNFLTVNLRRGKGDREADAGIEKCVVVWKIVKISPKYIAVYSQTACNRLRETYLVIIRASRSYRQPQHESAHGIKLWGARQQQILNRWSLKNAVVRPMKE